MTTSFNRLSSETSPYLLQHASNPVNWYPWGDEAFAKAKEENKLMLVSIGYSSCHWCHVMEKQAFSSSEVAEFMNNHYVCVKVDREERPDVDQIYMNAVQIITRSGGWPLNCFALPDGRPVFGGTYFQTEAWLDILKSLHFTWMSEPKRVLEVAEELTNGVSNTEIIREKVNINKFSSDTIINFVKGWSKYFDTRYGANKGAPKFPMPGSLQFLLDFAWAFNDDSVKEHVKLTLNKMANGGIYDHLGGGFFRYSVDDHWQVPHFEKMLYDNAQLVSLYSNAYRHFGDENYRSIVYQSIDFLRRELRSPDGGFFSAIDADSEGEEGKFYTFSKTEIDNILGPDAELFSIVYGMSASGNHIGKNVLRVAASINETACLLALSVDEVLERIKVCKTKLFNARATRIRPITDDKILVSWNALAITALVDAYLAFGDKRFLSDALTCVNFIENELMGTDGSLLRVHCKGKPSVSAFFDDYSFLIEAYLELYRATFNEEWVVKANKTLEFTKNKFFCDESGMFYYTSDEHDNIIVRKMELTDGVIPSSGAVMAENLMRLGVYYRNEGYLAMAYQMVSNLYSQFQKGGPYVYRWASSYLMHLLEPAELFASGDMAIETLKGILNKTNHPFIVPVQFIENSRLPIAKYAIEPNTIKVCLGKACQKPTDDLMEVIDTLEKAKRVS